MDQFKDKAQLAGEADSASYGSGASDSSDQNYFHNQNPDTFDEIGNRNNIKNRQKKYYASLDQNLKGEKIITLIPPSKKNFSDSPIVTKF